MGVSINGGTPKMGGFVQGKSHLEMDDLGVPPWLRKPPHQFVRFSSFRTPNLRRSGTLAGLRGFVAGSFKLSHAISVRHLVENLSPVTSFYKYVHKIYMCTYNIYIYTQLMMYSYVYCIYTYFIYIYTNIHISSYIYIYNRYTKIVHICIYIYTLYTL